MTGGRDIEEMGVDSCCNIDRGGPVIDVVGTEGTIGATCFLSISCNCFPIKSSNAFTGVARTGELTLGVGALFALLV